MRRSRLLLAVLAAVVLPAMAFASEISIRMAVNPETLDPTLVYTGDVNFINKMLFVNLCDFNEDKAIPTPDLAKSWEVSKDGLVWTFHLRNDVKWTDGTPVTAHDVEYSMKRILDPATASPLGFYMYMIKNSKAVNTGASKDMDSVGIKALDNWTIQFTLDKPLAFFPTQIRTVAFVAPKQAIDKFGARWFEPPNVISSGPYILQSWKQNDRLVFVKNPNYYDAKNVQIDKVTVFVVTDDSTAMAMYEAGQLDTTNVPAGDIDRVMKDPVLSKQTKSVNQLISYMFQFNVTQPPVDNVNVRKALAAAIDKESITRYVTKGGQIPMDTVTPPGAFGSIPKSAHIGIPYDPAAARDYLAKAGYPGGKGLPQITLNYNTSELNQAVAEAVQQMWKKNLGIDVHLKNIEGKVYWDAITSGNLQFWRMGVNADVPDADAFVYSTGHTTDSDRILKWTRTDFDKIVEQARVEPDPEKRKQLYMQAEKIMDQDEAVVIPIYSYAYVAITRPTLKRTYSSLMADTIKNWTVTK